MTVFIDDDVVPTNLQNRIEGMLNDRFFPWYLSEFKNSTCPEFLTEHFRKTLSNICENFQFVHQFISNNEIQSTYCEPILEISRLVQKKYNLPSHVYRIKANLSTNFYQNQSNSIQTPHIDCLSPHTTVIYYANDCDGDTVLFNELFNGTNIVDTDSLSIYKKITPKKGRCIIFNGFRFHSGAFPLSNSKRFVINFNFLLQPKTLI